MDTVGKRLQRAIDARQKSKLWLEKTIGAPVGYVSRVTRGKIADPHTDYVRAAAKALSVRLSWLAHGEGEMEAPSGALSLREDVPDSYTSDPGSFVEAVASSPGRWCAGRGPGCARAGRQGCA